MPSLSRSFGNAENEALHDVVTPVEVELPTPGRIVHLRINTDGPGEVLRPALVLDADTDGFLDLQVFLLPMDVPFANESRMRKQGDVFYAQAIPFGPECGEWRWPARLEEPVTFVAEV